VVMASCTVAAPTCCANGQYPSAAAVTNVCNDQAAPSGHGLGGLPNNAVFVLTQHTTYLDGHCATSTFSDTTFTELTTLATLGSTWTAVSTQTSTANDPYGSTGPPRVMRRTPCRPPVPEGPS
jgi:hypothetical protein